LNIFDRFCRDQAFRLSNQTLGRLLDQLRVVHLFRDLRRYAGSRSSSTDASVMAALALRLRSTLPGQ
jgi:hypothetical protein